MYLWSELDEKRRTKRQVGETDTRQETWGEGQHPRKDTSDTTLRSFPSFQCEGSHCLYWKDREMLRWRSEPVSNGDHKTARAVNSPNISSNHIQKKKKKTQTENPADNSVEQPVQARRVWRVRGWMVCQKMNLKCPSF